MHHGLLLVAAGLTGDGLGDRGGARRAAGRLAADGDGLLTARIPADFLKPDLHYKIEVGAREETGNQTFWEVPFCTYDGPECPE